MILWYIPVDIYLANYGLSTDQAGYAKSPLSDFPTCRKKPGSMTFGIYCSIFKVPATHPANLPLTGDP